MRRLLLIVGIAVVLALDWAAMHDIVNAPEPDLSAEYLMLVSGVVVIAFLLYLLARDIRGGSRGGDK
jgi:hypothetical protein